VRFWENEWFIKNVSGVSNVCNAYKTLIHCIIFGAL